jgi:antitoxin VapB
MSMVPTSQDSATAPFTEILAARKGRRYPGTRKLVEGWIMSLNIKNAETHHLVQELAALTGETQTMAVTIAVRERLERVRHLHEAGLADRLLAIGADTAPRLREPWRSADHGDLLYDDRGLPG